MSTSVGQDNGEPAAGWFGKLPGIGDFACRRLPQEFIQPWDAWLQAGISQTRNSLGDDWQELFLTFPVWRFVVPPAMFSASGWSGILLPSADRVGRCFPLTVAFAIVPTEFELLPITALEAPLELLADAALQALEADDAEGFDARLAMIAAPTPQPASVLPLTAAAAATQSTIEYQGALSDLLARSAARHLLSTLPPCTFWWVPPGPDAPGLALVAAALDAQAFERILQAREER